MCSLREEDVFVQNEVLKVMPDIILDTQIEHPKWVTLQSSKFCNGVFVLLEKDDMTPVFGKVFDVIVILNRRIVLCVQQYYGHVFNAHYNSFEITTRGIVSAVFVDQLDDHRPLHSTSTFVSSDLYITLPYAF